MSAVNNTSGEFTGSSPAPAPIAGVPSPAGSKLDKQTNQGSAEALIEISKRYRNGTNIRSMSLLYSIRNRKFIKGYITGCDVTYRILPGRYINFRYYSWTKDDPPNEIGIALVNYGRDGATVIKETVIKFYSREFLENINVKQILDFYEARPRYHTRPDRRVFDIRYTEEEHEKLIKLLEDTTDLREGEERE